MDYSGGVQSMYDYLMAIIPGATLTITHTVDEWLNGYRDPFLTFYTNLTIWHGGLSGIKDTYGIAIPYCDKKGDP
jgi:hypothetical protein